MKKYNPQKIEKKWQRYWEAKKLHHTEDAIKDKDNFMLLTEFPYPSGDLHIGHWYAFATPDILGRYLTMNGYNVMYPIGFDAFGLPAENAAIQRNINPRDWTEENIAYMTKQLKSIGARFDWSRTVKTIDPNYYKWTQWIFLKFYEKGLAYRTKTKVNWCPKDKTVLANEQVISGCCDRCGTPVIQKEREQWMFKITEYAQRLLDEMNSLDWPETIKTAQRNWIGKSQGTKIKFKVHGASLNIKDPFIEVFTTRADTLFGATYIVLAPEHELIAKLVTNDCIGQVNNYLEQVKKKTEFERTNLEKEKTGVNTGAFVLNPLNGEKIPIWIADYVIGSYGTGAVMAVPAHDQRDFEFAKKYSLPLRPVVIPNQNWNFEEKAYEGEGVLSESDQFNGLKSEVAREEITEKLTENKAGFKETVYRLHDWVLSRQRYWGVPIPMIYCQSCGYQKVSEKELPIKLPELQDFKPADDGSPRGKAGNSPLARASDWMKTKCPHCKKDAQKETDTMDTFVDSSWYFLRYTDPKNKKIFASKEKMTHWLPVHHYFGGAEHNTMHLLYSRFFTKALFDLGYIDFNEPFLKRTNRGFILGPDNQKMSKSKGNVIDPDEEVKKYGADTVRMYLAFMGPYENGGPWNPQGIKGVSRFLNRAWNFVQNSQNKKRATKNDSTTELIFSKFIKEIGHDIKNSRFNTGVSGLMKLTNELERLLGQKFKLSKNYYEIYLKLLAPFAPHFAEELWQEILENKTSIHLESWPRFNKNILDKEMINIIIQFNGKTRGVIKTHKDLKEESIKAIVLNDLKLSGYLKNKSLNKTVFIQNKLINFLPNAPESRRLLPKDE
ncbi:MAG: leucine--tRNA ligase [Parcubacteria group bacterium]|nr:leucine--tRNA ligase [Parcubacteria group bacterium]